MLRLNSEENKYFAKCETNENNLAKIFEIIGEVLDKKVKGF